MATKMGRPKLAKKDALGEVFAVRLRLAEAREVAGAIRVSGQPRPDWLRAALLAAARKEQSPKAMA